MRAVRIGRRLVFVLLLAVTPVVATYTYWLVQWSGRNYIADLKRETRAMVRGAAPIVEGYARQEEWTSVHEFFQRMSLDGTKGALLKANGEVWYAVPDLPSSLVAQAQARGLNTEGLEFEQGTGDRYWFCRVVPLNSGELLGYLLVAQDWTNIAENVRERMLPPIGAALIVIILITATIPLAVSRYVSKPLAELSRKVMQFSTDSGNVHLGGDEVELLGEEFQRLDRQLTKAHDDLLARHRRELELERRLERANRLATIGTLASGLAHEIGTPMGVIRTRTELLLQRTSIPEKTRETLEIILSQIDRVSKIVRMLLDYARVRESRRVRVDVRTIIQQVVKLLEAQAKRSGVRIVQESNPFPLGVECDPDQLQQVFVNLAVNAFDAMAPGGGELRLSASVEQTEHQRSVLKVVFQDTGPGVAEEFRRHLFDPFFTTKPPGKGAGMGLSVSQSIIRDHNGEITFDTGSGGSRFSVILPIADPGTTPGDGGEARMEPAK